MATIKHKRSSTQGAVPQLNEFAEGEILINSHDGKAFIKKVTPQGSEVVQLRNTREDVRPAGQTGEDNVSETGIRTALNELTDGIIPNYFVTNLTEFLAAYSAIRANYAGGNIYITGEIIMTQNLFLDLRGIEIIGRFCIWRHYNSTLLNPNPADVYKIIITRGSPTFRGVTFYGSSGQSSLALESGTNRHIIELNTTYTGESITVNFESCNFYDVVCGVSGTVISVTISMDPYAGINVNFKNCRVSTHNAGNYFTYAPFLISHTYPAPGTSTKIRVSVVDHIGADNDNKVSSQMFGFDSNDEETRFYFHHDETAFTQDKVEQTNSFKDTPTPLDFTEVEDNGIILITVGRTIWQVPAKAFINYVSAGAGYAHPTGFTPAPQVNLQGSEVISQIKVNNEGHVEGVITRNLDYDKFEKFRIGYQSGLTNAYSDCVGANGALPAGGNRGLKLVAGNNIELSPYVDADKILNVIITANPSTASLFGNKAVLAQSIAPISANAWYQIDATRINADEPGTYLVTAQVHLYRSGTGLSVIEARIYSSDGTVSSAETAPASASSNRASMHMSSIVVVNSSKFWFEIQVRTNVTNAWGIGGSTTTSAQPGATQISIVKIA